MTIDPTKFEPQGKPTHEQARAVWDTIANPSSRRVAAELINRGFDAHWRTIARWHANSWEDHRPVSEEVRRRMRRAQKAIQVQKDAKEFANLPGSPPPLTLDEYALIAQRRAELMLLSEAELDKTEARARKIMNILIAEQAAQRAHVMVLIPKDTGSLLGALADAQKVGMTGGIDQPPVGGDARVINGSATHIESSNPLASAIGKFLADIEAA